MVKRLYCEHGKQILRCMEYPCKDIPRIMIRKLCWDNYERKPNEFHVTEVIGCLARAYYHRINKRRGVETFAGVWRAWEGQRIHGALGYMFGGAEIPVELPFEVDGVQVKVVGRVDSFAFIGNTLRDYKRLSYGPHSVTKEGQPFPDHALQLQAYQTLIHEGHSIEKREILYVTPDGVYPTTVPFVDRKKQIIERATTLYRAVRDRIPPAREPCYECFYFCPFFYACDLNTGDGSLSKVRYEYMDREQRKKRFLQVTGLPSIDAGKNGRWEE